jgi:hypothetical protein
MYLYSKTSARSKSRKRSSRYRAKLKANNRRRVNRMAGKSRARRLFKK